MRFDLRARRDPYDLRVLLPRFHLDTLRVGVTWLGFARRQSFHAAMPNRIAFRLEEPRTFLFSFGGWVCLGIVSVWFSFVGGRS